MRKCSRGRAWHLAKWDCSCGSSPASPIVRRRPEPAKGARVAARWPPATLDRTRPRVAELGSYRESADQCAAQGSRMRSA
jgi:hypothetical protein